MELFAAIKEEVGNLLKLLNPYRVSEFFRNMEIRSVSYMFKYLSFMSLFLFTGYFLNLRYKTGFEPEINCSDIPSIESAFITCVVLVLSTITAGYVISAASKGLVGRFVKADEMVSIMGYSMAVILFGGIFRAHLMTIVLYYAAIAYGIYLLYAGIRARFGFDKAIVCFLFSMIVISLAIIAIFQIFIALIGLLMGIGVPLRLVPAWCY
jgi:hypothetical protein